MVSLQILGFIMETSVPKTHSGEAHDDKFYQLVLQRNKKY